MKKTILIASAIALLGAFSASAADFGGAYVGGDLNYSKTELSKEDASGFSGGLSAGYGKELGSWYVGGEIGGGFTGIEGEAKSGSIEKKNYVNGAARLGYKATDSVLAYGLIGLESAEFDHATGSDRDLGIRYGLGVETFVKDNISIRGQIEYVDWQGKQGLPEKGEWRTGLGVSYHFN